MIIDRTFLFLVMEKILDLMPIDGFDGYFVNGDGSVYSNKQGAVRQVSVLKKPFGLWYVQLYIHTVKYQRPVHRLVAEAFIPNPDGLRFVVFKDGNKDNYHVENLMWHHNRKHIPKGKWVPVPGLNGVFITKNGDVRMGDRALDIIKHSDGNPRVQIPGIGIKAVGLLLAMAFPVIDKKKVKAKRKILTEDQVAKIKAEYRPREVTLNALSSKYGVSLSTIRDIVIGRSWAEIKPSIIENIEIKTISVPQKALILLKQWIPIRVKVTEFIPIILYASKTIKGASFQFQEDDGFVIITRTDKK